MCGCVWVWVWVWVGVRAQVRLRLRLLRLWFCVWLCLRSIGGLLACLLVSLFAACVMLNVYSDVLSAECASLVPLVLFAVVVEGCQ